TEIAKPESAATTSSAATTPTAQRTIVTSIAAPSAPRPSAAAPGAHPSPRRRELCQPRRGLGFVLEGDDLPRRAIGEQRADESVVERVPGLERAIRGEQRMPGEHEIADRVEDLVLDELVVVAEAVAVENLELVDDDRVVEAAAERETARAHHLDVLGEAERARPRDLVLVLARPQVEDEALTGLTDDRMVELDLEAERVALVRLDPCPLQLGALALADLD